MGHRRAGRELLGAAAAALALALHPQVGGAASSPPAVTASGDDLFLLTAATSPNVVLVMDNSPAMQQIEWHPAFDPDADPATYGCSYFDNATVYDASSINDSATICGHKRTVYAPMSPTLWDGRYLNWYYGLPDGEMGCNLTCDATDPSGCQGP